MAGSTTRTTAAAITAAVLATSVLLLLPPAASARRGPVGSRCDAARDVAVSQSAGDLQADGAKEYTVVVSNQGHVAVWGIHLMCGYHFRYVRPVDPDLLVEVGTGDCLLIDGEAIAPGGNVSFAYTNYVRYPMTVVAASCTAQGT